MKRLKASGGMLHRRVLGLKVRGDGAAAFLVFANHTIPPPYMLRKKKVSLTTAWLFHE